MATFDPPPGFDTTPPVVAALSPANGGKSVDIAGNIVVTFNESVLRGAGLIYLRNQANLVVESFDVASSSRISIAGNVLTLNPSADLAFSSTYRVELAPGSVRDLAGNAFAGNSAYSFATFNIPQYVASYGDLIQAFGLNFAAATAHYVNSGKAEGRTATFDALRYVASYGDLIAILGTNAAAATEHYIAYGAAEGRSGTFDALRYVASYGDLIGAFALNRDAATEHYIAFGAAEGRAPSFDALRYIASYGDLIGIFGTNQAAATEHYITYGAAEGRTANFDALRYTATYGDLIGAFGTNSTLATNHYIAYGAAEGRTASFDGLRYIASYGDLIGILGSNATAGIRHYVNFGYAEGRRSTFDPAKYLLANPDLQPFFGSNAAGATLHYIQFGAREGRPTSLPSGPLAVRTLPEVDSAVFMTALNEGESQRMGAQASAVGCGADPGSSEFSFSTPADLVGHATQRQVTRTQTPQPNLVEDPATDVFTFVIHAEDLQFESTLMWYGTGTPGNLIEFGEAADLHRFPDEGQSRIGAVAPLSAVWGGQRDLRSTDILASS